ncbi:MAG TPA: hypothetical protein VFP80_17290 [Thermoanaerobaculia bacterium]|nr:hypothetical protein [Thermoanaerobaculia bacterium]
MPGGKAVFINVPFDAGYESLFVTLVGTLTFLGQEPHCVLEVGETGEGRLARIFELMRSCRVSVHDLSRSGNPVRFNMPFELGLACALKLTSPADYEIFVLDGRPFRADRTLSDYKGRDPLIHNGTNDGMLGCVLDMFTPVVGYAASSFRNAAKELRKVTQALKADLRATSVFRPAMFRLLVNAASRIAMERGFIPPRER